MPFLDPIEPFHGQSWTSSKVPIPCRTQTEVFEVFTGQLAWERGGLTPVTTAQPPPVVLIMSLPRHRVCFKEGHHGEL